MNHPFIKAPWNANVCAKCAKAKDLHELLPTCESCGKVIDCDVIEFQGKKLTLCVECKTKHNKAIELEIKIEKERSDSVNKFINDSNRLADSQTIKSIVDQAITGNIKQYTDFFNAKMVPIVELEKLINESPEFKDNDERTYYLARTIHTRMKYLTDVLFHLRSGEMELTAEVKVIQEYMNNLIPKVREEKRKEFAEHDITYQVPTNAPKTPKMRLSTEDKMAEDLARALKIPIEVAKRKLANKMRNENVECTCAVTPGICKRHK